MSTTRTRNVDQEVARLSGLLGPLVRDGRHEEARQTRRELDYAKRLARIRAAVKDAPPLDPAVRDAIVGMLYAAGSQAAAA